MRQQYRVLSSSRPHFRGRLSRATHHPYRLPQGEIDRLRAQGVDPDAMKVEQRYGLLAMRADQLVGKVVESLDRRGLRERTLIVIFGDHGEGFGEKGVRRHDNNYYQEGIRVPLVVAGPGISPRRLADDVSLLDIAPTLLRSLGFDFIRRDDPLYGRPALEQYSGPRSEYFSCYYDGVCYGVVRGANKLIVLPELKRALRFDLAADPDERKPLRVSHDAPELAELGKLVSQLRLPSGPAYGSNVTFDNGWLCPKTRHCRHPKTPAGVFFQTAIPDECVQVKSNAVESRDGYDHKLSLHNICSGLMVCEVGMVADSGRRQTVKLKPDEWRDLVFDHQADDANLNYDLDCQFL